MEPQSSDLSEMETSTHIADIASGAIIALGQTNKRAADILTAFQKCLKGEGLRSFNEDLGRCGTPKDFGQLAHALETSLLFPREPNCMPLNNMGALLKNL
jgi:hypothetical protein